MDDSYDFTQCLALNSRISLQLRTYKDYSDQLFKMVLNTQVVMSTEVAIRQLIVKVVKVNFEDVHADFALGKVDIDAQVKASINSFANLCSLREDYLEFKIKARFM